MAAESPAYKTRVTDRGKSLSDYWPLFSLVLVAILASTAISWPLASSMSTWMHYFMGFLLCSFSMLKLFNISAFADGFQMVDPIGKRSRSYSKLYPFLELALGLGYLSFIAPTVVYWATIIILGISAFGVFKALKEGLDINCPCMGSVLSVPLSTVTLTEDLTMIGMAILLLV